MNIKQTRIVEVAVLIGGLALACARAQENGIQPGEVSVTPTIHCIGIYWPVQGDLNGNATADVEYSLQGSGQWKKAFPLWRVTPRVIDIASNTVDGLPFWQGKLEKWAKGGEEGGYAFEHWKMNYLAGSILGLQAGSGYDIRISLNDPDGGSTNVTLSATTRPVPEIPTNGNVIVITNGTADLTSLIKIGKPGDIFNLQAGTYSPFVIHSKGEAGKPLVVKSAGDGPVVIKGEGSNGVEVRGSHVILAGLTVEGFAQDHNNGIKVERNVTGVSVMRCTVKGCWTGIFCGGSNGYYADNTVVGIKEPDKLGDHTEGHGIEIFSGRGGPGNVICYNTITHVADSLRVHCTDADVYGNGASFGADDAIEADDGGPNLRIYDNLFYCTGQNGISFQPYMGGPAYIVRNIVVNDVYQPIKDRYKSSGVIMVNNTFVALALTEDAYNELPEHVFARNNLFISTHRDAMQFHPEDILRPTPSLDIDYDGFTGKITGRHAEAFKKTDMKALPLSKFTALTGQEKHGIELKAEDCFKLPLPAPAQIKEMVATWTGPAVDFSLKEGSPAIDAGVVVPNLAEDFNGKAPDLGAIEFTPSPHWGVRPLPAQ